MVVFTFAMPEYAAPLELGKCFWPILLQRLRSYGPKVRFVQCVAVVNAAFDNEDARMRWKFEQRLLL
jgi:hypothetical protein